MTTEKRLTKEEAKQVAETTLEQLGGVGRLTAMIGATNFTFDHDGTLTFRFKMCKKANAVRIQLNDSDLYDIEFLKINSRTFDLKVAERVEGAYCDQMKGIFEEFTGLYLSLN